MILFFLQGYNYPDSVSFSKWNNYTSLDRIIGQYTKMEGVSSHGRPVWKHENSDTYLFYSSDSYWRVGYAYGGNAGGWIQSNERGLEEIPRTNWNNGVTVEGLFVLLMYLTTSSYLQFCQS